MMRSERLQNARVFLMNRFNDDTLHNAIVTDAIEVIDKKLAVHDTPAIVEIAATPDLFLAASKQLKELGQDIDRIGVLMTKMRIAHATRAAMSMENAVIEMATTFANARILNDIIAARLMKHRTKGGV